MLRIETPIYCPSCSSDLERVKDILYCRNDTCSSKSEKKIQHFAKSLKIKGLGPATISKLQINSIDELYMLSLEYITDALSSEKLATKLLAEIENSKKAPLNILLPGFSIPLIGISAARKLSGTCEFIYDITEPSCRAAGLGPKATENLLNWKRREFPALEDLPFSFKFNYEKEPDKVRAYVCISGRLTTCKTKAEAALLLSEFGYGVKNSLTKDVSILLNESGVESTKTKTARESGIKIVTDLLDLIGE